MSHAHPRAGAPQADAGRPVGRSLLRLLVDAMWAAAAGLASWLAVVVPQQSNAGGVADAVRAQQIAENGALCERWGLAAGTARHAACARELVDLRAKERTRFLEGFEARY